MKLNLKSNNPNYPFVAKLDSGTQTVSQELSSQTPTFAVNSPQFNQNLEMSSNETVGPRKTVM